MSVYILIHLVATATVAIFVIRPRGTVRWAFWIVAPLVVAATLLFVEGMRPIRPPTLADILFMLFLAALLIREVAVQPEVRRWWARRGK
jgi:hypothetical protein